ncbi:unnamed protein product [Paramecium sonneborni]|uniref:Uncharacterized protein n=1 Tax=Paramecium sonneborni TaxID=65129 RepID=A0A8S1LP52_9CILI|nr:unnamed protein product [Paramecium sonneborni]
MYKNIILLLINYLCQSYKEKQSCGIQHKKNKMLMMIE